ncbi:MAG: hypothetical protein KKH02_05985 [Proteobacteria bacterium]|nr:hypothetical protein [Pseudomonadota bacterium]MBU4581951.1 hypothetical protein [Pseudomonadota bacterium]MCG2739747.1 hypothetical protein [Syntrophaceae bacterium]
MVNQDEIAGEQRRIMKAIASKINMPYVRVFPEYYLQPPKRSTSKVACG